jgi:site-specific DNA-methyltransferase (adenine-specific)
MKKYNVIYADPPWPESYESMIPCKERRQQGALLDARKHFTTVSEAEIAMLGFGLEEYVADNCALFLWSTSRHLPMALRIMNVWGFRFVNVAFTWMKKNPKSGTPFVGLGFYTKHNAEFCLLGVRGSMRPVQFNVPSAVYEPKAAAFTKPATVRDRIVRLFGDVPRLELFARQQYEGWDVWGNEVESNIILDCGGPKCTNVPNVTS